MTTLLAVYDKSGPEGSLKCVGRCDARCYEASSPECTCVCGGRNHGKGQTIAMENTSALFEVMAEEWLDEHSDEREPEFRVPGDMLDGQ